MPEVLYGKIGKITVVRVVFRKSLTGLSVSLRPFFNFEIYLKFDASSLAFQLHFRQKYTTIGLIIGTREDSRASGGGQIGTVC